MNDQMDDRLRLLKMAGADNLAFNAPLGGSRSADLLARLLAGECTAVVDLGCGHGELMRMLAREPGPRSIVGVEIDPDLVRKARRLKKAENLADHLSFDLADASGWMGTVDAAVCVGVSHVFGGLDAMFDHLGTLVPAGQVVIGEAVWQSHPDSWCRGAFGDLPFGLEGLVDVAADRGWTVGYSGLSTTPEWDEFENLWIAGVRSVGSAEAESFAAEREAQYQKYRGVLGFGWLHLHRVASDIPQRK